MRTLASLDIGSNTILLLVARVSKGKAIFPLVEKLETPRLAENLNKTGRISPECLKRAIRSINSLQETAWNWGAEEIFAVATQAIRSATNRAETIRAIYMGTGIRPEVITGRQEAVCTYLGALTGMSNLKSNRILFDIGGASTEFVKARGKQIHQALSLPIGAIEITEKFGTDQKKSWKELLKIEEALETFFHAKLPGFQSSDFSLIGSGGTISTLKMLSRRSRNFRSSIVHGKSLKLHNLVNLIGKLAAMELPERRKAIAFDPKRAEVIVGGGLMLMSILNHFGRPSARVSTRSLRWGFLVSKL